MAKQSGQAQDGGRYVMMCRRLQIAREALGLTQAAVAEILGWSQPKVSNTELGRRSVNLLDADQLMVLYRMTPAELFAPLSSDERDLLAQWRGNYDDAMAREAPSMADPR